MNENWLDRTELMIGKENVEKLKSSSVLVAGVGGVGGIASEMLCRAGIGRLSLIDADTVDLTNLNRQAAALHSTLGKEKVEVLAQRFLDINPDILLDIYPVYLEENNIGEILEKTRPDCILDAIDTLGPKVMLSVQALKRGIPIVACMGAGARLDPEKIRCTDISKTFSCPLAKAFRHGLAQHGIRHGVRAVFSTENAIRSAIRQEETLRGKRSCTGTLSFMPNLFGCHCAAEVIRLLLPEGEIDGSERGPESVL
jgi:tRNA A37 threonylcarbamoyladenosine dehydratase